MVHEVEMGVICLTLGKEEITFCLVIYECFCHSLLLEHVASLVQSGEMKCNPEMVESAVWAGTG